MLNPTHFVFVSLIEPSLSQHITASMLRSRIYVREELFVPLDPQCKSLSQTTIEHSAHYNVIVPGLGPLRLQVTFREALAGEFENFSRLWLKSDSSMDGSQSDARPKIGRPVEIDFIRLDTILAWNLQLSATNIIGDGKITESMRQFAESVALKADHLRHNRQDSNLISIVDCHHRTSQKFILKGSNYVVELSESVPVNLKGRSMAEPKLPSNERLEMSMYQNHWDSTLETQKSLPIGIAGDWNPSFSSFFPIENRSDQDRNGLERVAEKARAMLELL